MSQSASGAGGMLGGQSISSPGAMQSRTAVPSVSLNLRPTSGASDGKSEDDVGGDKRKNGAAVADGELESELARREEVQFTKAEADLRQALEESPELNDLKKHLIVDRTPEGLRIQIVDQERRSMFPSGSARMLDRTRALLRKIATVVQSLPNKIAISGHTDSKPFRGRDGYGNWELSAERANASRRELLAAGMPAERIEKVVGSADRQHLIKDDPKSPRNRRISIVLLRQAGKGAAKSGTSAQARAPATFRRDWTGPRLR